MGNTSSRAPQHREPNPQPHTASQFSLSNLFGSTSGRSLVSVSSNQTVCSAQRPWSRISRRGWHRSTLSSPLEASKTAWPVPRVEALFLPEFPVTTELSQRDFSVLETIAKGAFGEVYKVKRESTDKIYALKVLGKGQVVSENAVRQVKEEAKIQELCGHHSFIVGSVSRWQTKKRLYIVSEYIPGGELLALLDRYRILPEQLVRIYIAELALALEFLHGAGVVFRDLKPENVLLDAAGHLQLIDFGLSKWLSRGARTHTLCGTLKYMAPEVFSTQGYGHAVDWWSLGVVACRMLTDEYPTPPRPAAQAGAEDAGAVDTAAPASPAGSLPVDAGAGAATLSDGARKLLQRLLDVDPQRRLRSLRQLQQTAFYVTFDFECVRQMKTSPRSLLEQHFPVCSPGDPAACEVRSYSEELRAACEHVFADFDRATFV